MEFLRENKLNIIRRHLGPHSREVYAVGGFTRDTLIGRAPKDLDLAIKLHPQKVMEILAAQGVHVIATGIRRGTVTAIIDGEPVEFTTFRNYGAENTFSETIEEDLASRDFTINAIAINIFDGTVVDPFNGVEDLRTGTLNTVGAARKRFTEDPHRMLRLFRFGYGQGRKVNAEAEEAVRELSGLLNTVAAERIKDEILKIIGVEHIGVCLEKLYELNILKIILPELHACYGVEQNKYHTFDVFTHIAKVVAGIPRYLTTARMAALLHDIAKPLCISFDEKGEKHFLGHEDRGALMAEQIMSRLKFPREMTDAVRLLVQNHMRAVFCGDKGIRRIIREMGAHLNDFLWLKYSDGFSGKNSVSRLKWDEFICALCEEEDRQSRGDGDFMKLSLNGHQIMDLTGLKQGPAVGELIAQLQEIVFCDPRMNTPEVLTAELKRITEAA